MPDSEIETTTEASKSLEFKITIEGVEYGLDLAKLTYREAGEIEARTGRRYGEVLFESLSGAGFEYAAGAVIAAIAQHRIDDETSLQEYIDTILDLPIDAVRFKYVSAEKADEPVGPTKPKRASKKAPETSGSRS